MRESRFLMALSAVLAEGRTARFQARGHSMCPTISDGDFLLIEPLGGSRPRVGDVVLTSTARGLTAHRVAALIPQGEGYEVVTRGDNSLERDPRCAAGQVLGIVTGFERSEAATRHSTNKLLATVRILVRQASATAGKLILRVLSFGSLCINRERA